MGGDSVGDLLEGVGGRGCRRGPAGRCTRRLARASAALVAVEIPPAV